MQQVASRRGIKQLRGVRFALSLFALFVGAFLLSGFYAAHTYVGNAMHMLDTTVPAVATGESGHMVAWWSADADHVEALVAEWPASLPTLIGEALLLWGEQFGLRNAESIDGAGGYTIVPPSSAGTLHLLSASIKARLNAIVHRWDRAQSDTDLTHLRGYPILLDGAVDAVDPDEVLRIIDELRLPASVFEGYRIVLLPFALERTAGLGAEGEAIIGAAPATGATNPHRTAYTLLHELGHHIHFTYMDNARNGDHLWDEYMKLRGIEEWIASGSVGTQAWFHSAQETFAEDFRILFGPREVRDIPHGTAFGDPRNLPDGGEAVRTFILDLISK